MKGSALTRPLRGLSLSSDVCGIFPAGGMGSSSRSRGRNTSPWKASAATWPWALRENRRRYFPRRRGPHPARAAQQPQADKRPSTEYGIGCRIRCNQGDRASLSGWTWKRPSNRALQPLFRQRSASVSTVVLDPGHGGHDRGARAALALRRTLPLDVVSRVRKRLRKSRPEGRAVTPLDTFIPLESRPAMTKKYPNPIFVSIHFNSADWNRRAAATAWETFAISPLGASAAPRQEASRRPATACASPAMRWSP